MTDPWCPLILVHLLRWNDLAIIFSTIEANRSRLQFGKNRWASLS
jgi:hypothetical protein